MGAQQGQYRGCLRLGPRHRGKDGRYVRWATEAKIVRDNPRRTKRPRIPRTLKQNKLQKWFDQGSWKLQQILKSKIIYEKFQYQPNDETLGGEENPEERLRCHIQERGVPEAGWRCREIAQVRTVPRTRNRPGIQLFDRGRFPQDQINYIESWHTSGGKRCAQNGVVETNSWQD